MQESSSLIVQHASSFASALKEMSKEDKGSLTTWIRTAVPETGNAKPQIKFQNIDVQVDESARDLKNSEILLFGVTEDGHSILVRALGFEHYLYYPAPTKLSNADLDPLRDYLNALIKSSAEFSSNWPVSRVEIKEAKTRIPGARIFNEGECQYKNLFSSPAVSEGSQVPYFLRFMVDKGITAMAWLNLPAEKYEIILADKTISHCQLEVSINVNDLGICDPIDSQKYAPLRILSLDIETHVPETDGVQPNAQVDPVLQIGSMVTTYGEANPFIRTIFTLKSCSPIAGAQVLSYESEADLLTAWKNFVIEVDPDVVTGYNIAQFDIPYLLNRAIALGVSDFPYLGRIKSSPQRLFGLPRNYLWNCPSFEGRLLLDVFFHIRSSKQFQGKGSSTLNAVSRFFLGEQKENLHYKHIPILHNGSDDDRRTLAIYCLKAGDVYLTLRLLPKVECLEKEVEAARAAHIPFNAMRGKSYLIAIAKSCREAVARQYHP